MTMSNTAQSLPIDLLRPSSSSSKNPVSSVKDFAANPSQDTGFSRELKRASNQTRPSETKDTRPQSDPNERGVRRQSEQASSSQRTDRDHNSRTGSKRTGESEQNSTSSSTETTSKSEKTENTDTRPRLSADKVDPQNRKSADDKTQSTPETDRNVSESVKDVSPATGEAATVVDAETGAGVGVEILDISDASVPANPGIGIAELQKHTDKSDSQKETVVALSTSPTDKGIVAKASTQAVVPGEQLSPVELANRQTHLVGQPHVKDRQSAATLMAQGANELTGTDSEGEIASVRAGISQALAGLAGHSTAAQGRDGASLQQPTPSALNSRAESMQVVAEQAQAAEQLKSADLKAAVEMNAKMVAEKSEQQVAQANLAQAQIQAKQQTIQAFANQNASVVANDSASAGNLSSDNTFLSVSGGIVTAPVLPRPDASGTQTVTTPLNMPILQNDADKTMASNIRWMVNEGVKNAVINVTPSGMGPISVTIGMENDHMNVSIVAMQGSTREALDSMLPRLREQLATQGHDNVKVDISDGGAEHSDRGNGQKGSDRGQGSENQLLVAQKENTGTDQVSEQPLERPLNYPQGLMTTDSNGQIRSRYDVYV